MSCTPIQLTLLRGPKFSYTKGKTPILTPNEARKLIRSIPTDTLMGLRDRALIGLMLYTFARVSAAVNMNVKDVYQKQETLWVRLHEKGGKHHEMPCQHNLKDWLREYLEAAGIADDKDAPLFRTVDRKTRKLGSSRLDRQRAWAMVKRRAKKAGIETTGIRAGPKGLDRIRGVASAVEILTWLPLPLIRSKWSALPPTTMLPSPCATS